MNTTEDILKEFDELDIHISLPNSLAEEEQREKLKLFVPIVWDLLKPSIRYFIASKLEGMVSVEEVREAIKQIRKPMLGIDQYGTELYESGKGYTYFNDAIDRVLSLLDELKEK